MCAAEQHQVRLAVLVDHPIHHFLGLRQHSNNSAGETGGASDTHKHHKDSNQGKMRFSLI